MKQQLMVLTGLLFMVTVADGSEQQPLDMEQYLKQVFGKNDALHASMLASQAGELTAGEPGLVLSPTLFGSAQFLTDQKETSNPSFSGTKTQARTYQLGVSKLTTFGLSGKLYYSLTGVDLTGASAAFVPLASYYEAKPVLEVSQSLLKNGFGYGTRSTLAAQEAQKLATSYGESFKVKLAIAEAEQAYWRLALARKVVSVQRQSQARATKIRDWSEGRAKLQLADRSDLLQAEAALQAKNLELQAALDDERAAARALNSLRGVDSEDVSEELVSPDSQWIESLEVPKNGGPREDLKAAEQSMIMSESLARGAQNALLPDLEVFGNFAYNGRAVDSSTSISRSFDGQHPTWLVGVRFTAPLDIGTLSRSRDGRQLEREAAERLYQRKLFDQGREWGELVKKLSESKERLKLAQSLVELQKSKLEYERSRHSRGRTTTYQVLLFEQDYSTSQLTKIRIESEVLGLVAQMKTYGSLK